MRLPLFRKLIADEKGASAIMIAVMAAVLIAFVSLGVEVVLALKTQRDMQSAADSAVLAAVTASKATYPSITTEGYSVAGQAGFTSSNHDCTSTDTVVVQSPPTADCGASAAFQTSSYIEALIREPFNLRLAKVLYPGDFVLHGHAVAFWNAGEGCVAILDPHSAGSFHVAGGASATMLNCDVYVNSNDTSAGAAKVDGGATLTCDHLHVAGVSSPDPIANCPVDHKAPIPDPFKSIGMPTATGGTVSNSGTISPITATNLDGLKPVNLTGGISLTGSGTTQFICPGIYIITGPSGKFKINGSNFLTMRSPNQFLSDGTSANPTYDSLFTTHCGANAGTGVAFVLTGSGGSSTTNVQVQGDVIVRGIDAGDPTNHPQQTASGVGLPIKTVFWQNRNASTTPSSQLSGTNSVVDGLLYFPNQILATSGNSNQRVNCFLAVSWQLTITGSPFYNADGCDPGFTIGGQAILAE